MNVAQLAISLAAAISLSAGILLVKPYHRARKMPHGSIQLFLLGTVCYLNTIQGIILWFFLNGSLPDAISRVIGCSIILFAECFVLFSLSFVLVRYYQRVYDVERAMKKALEEHHIDTTGC